jgi:alpha-glucosidase
VPENYDESVVEYGGLMKIIFRAYDEGIAFCYEFETKENVPTTLKRELTEFAFDDDYPCWAVYSAQGIYEQVPLSKVKKGCERPLLVEVPDGPAISIGEARLVDFARMKFQPSTEKPTWLTASLDGNVVIQGTGKPYRSPWRFVMAAGHPGKLVEHNYMLLNLNEPSTIADPSWIKPGKVIRETTLTTAGGKACVDFAVERNLQYIEFDAGWYGHEHDDASDATFVSVDPKRNPNPNPLDLPAVMEYAQSKKIGVILYVNHRALEKQLDDLLPLYKKWGVSGIKYGFVNVGSQHWTTWLHDAVAKTAKHELVIDIHDEYRCTGWERTYPNLLTVEGIGGNETKPTTQHNCTLALTRTLCGAGDYTHCWYKLDTYKGTRAHQLATVVVFYSPLQFLYWYDRPQDYKAEPELDFWKTIPTVWNETRVLNGEVGKFVTFARRTGAEWYIGTISSGDKRTLRLPLDFLEKGKKYEATHYSDVPEDRLKVRIERKLVDADTVLDLDIAPDGGAALRVVPQ